MPDILRVKKDIYIVFREAKKRLVATHIDPSSFIRIIKISDGIASCDEIPGTNGANDPSINFIDGKFYLNYFTWRTPIFALVPWFEKLKGITVLKSKDCDFWERTDLKGTEGFATSAKIVKFRDKLLLPAYRTEGEKDRAVILTSDNDFKDFECSPIPQKPYQHYQEPALLLLEDDVLAVMRTSKGFLYQSLFDGEKWSFPEKTTMFGFPPDLIKRKDGTIVCIYCDRLNGFLKYAVNQGDIKPNEWEEYDISTVNSMDSGYPSVVDMGDKLFCVYYDRENGTSCIKGEYFFGH